MTDKKPTPLPWHRTKPIKLTSNLIEVADADKRITVVRWGKPEDEADVCICVGPDQEANADAIVNALADSERLREALEEIAFKPFGHAEASDREVLDAITAAARAALTPPAKEVPR